MRFRTAPEESGGKLSAVQKLREVCGRPVVAQRLESARGFSTAFGRGERFNPTGFAEIRLVSLESDLFRRNQMMADESG